MPPVTVTEDLPNANVPKEAPEQAPPKQSIGIIYPPPELRNIVDKTASFVARNGPEFEARICQNEINNPKFNFLNAGDPYNAYYQHRVKEFKEGKGPEPPAPQSIAKPLVVQKPEISKIIEQPIVPKEPPPEYEYIYDPPSISAYDLDLVKLTAQFVARNGRQFLINLMNREQRNSQFDFLRPQHSLCKYFLKLFEQYTKILIPPKDLMSNLKKDSDASKLVFDAVRYRVEWTKQQEAQKRREAEEAERERVQYAQIDWHDFIVVETVDYQPNEQGLFPPPTTPDEVGTRVLAQKRIEEEGEEVEMEVDSDEGSDDEAPAPKETEKEEAEPEEAPPSPPPLPPKEAPPQPPPLPPQPDQVVVRKDYNPKVSKSQAPSSEQYLVSPITGERIPADKMQEHMRIGLLDPRWVEQRDRSLQEKMVQEEVYAVGSAIESSLKQFAERRTDIFGFGDEEAAIGKKIGEEEEHKRPEKVTWDGHTASMEAATRAARANITIEEQIQQIHKIKGLLPDEEKERIGPSKPQNPSIVVTTQPAGLPPVPPTPASTTSASSGTTASTSTTGNTTSTQQLPQLPKPVIKPPLPTIALITTTITPNPAPPVQRPPLPPLPPTPQLPPGPVHGLMHPPQPLMGHPPGLMMTPLGPPRPPMQPLLAMQPHLGPPMPSPFGPPGPPMGPPQQMGGPHELAFPTSVQGGDDEPPNKRLKAEDQLMPESDFLKKFKSPVTFRVQVPKITDKSEWKLNGQFITVTLPLTDMVSVMKSKIHEDTGMPPGKQKLQLEGLFLKDSNTMAYYNIAPGCVVSLQLKERGGRKK